MEIQNDSLDKFQLDQAVQTTPDGSATKPEIACGEKATLNSIRIDEKCSGNFSSVNLGTGIAVTEQTKSTSKAKVKKSNGRKPRRCINIDGKKRYPCPFPGCNKTFSTSGHSSRHSRIHTGEKPYRCTYPNCNAQFSRYDNSVQHYRTHMVSFKGSKKGRGKLKEKLTPEDTDPQPVRPENIKSKMVEEPMKSLKRSTVSMNTSPEADHFMGQGKLAKVEQLDNSVSVQPSSTKGIQQDPSIMPRSNTVPVLSSLAPGSSQQTWLKTAHPMQRSIANIQSLPRAPFSDYGNSMTHGCSVAASEHPTTEVASDNFQSTCVNLRKLPNTGIQKQPSDPSSYALNSSNFSSIPFQSRIPHGSRMSPELLLARESFLSPGQRMPSDANGDSQSTRPTNFQLHKSGSMPSLLSLEMPHSDSSHSLSKYSLSSRSPTLTATSPFKGLSNTSSAKHL